MFAENADRLEIVLRVLAAVLGAVVVVPTVGVVGGVLFVAVEENTKVDEADVVIAVLANATTANPVTLLLLMFLLFVAVFLFPFRSVLIILLVLSIVFSVSQNESCPSMLTSDVNVPKVEL